MATTGRLGMSDSKPGNIQLGKGVPAPTVVTLSGGLSFSGDLQRQVALEVKTLSGGLSFTGSLVVERMGRPATHVVTLADLVVHDIELGDG